MRERQSTLNSSRKDWDEATYRMNLLLKMSCPNGTLHGLTALSIQTRQFESTPAATAPSARDRHAKSEARQAKAQQPSSVVE